MAQGQRIRLAMDVDGNSSFYRTHKMDLLSAANNVEKGSHRLHRVCNQSRGDRHNIFRQRFWNNIKLRGDSDKTRLELRGDREHTSNFKTMTHARNASLVTRRNAARNKTSQNKARRNNNPETIRKTMTIHDNECRARQNSTTKTNNNKQHMCTRNLPNQNRKHECQTSMWHGEKMPQW